MSQSWNSSITKMAGVGPQFVQVLDFATARAPELQALHDLAQHASMKSSADGKLESQKNQRRRRANAFKSYRMPQRLRQPPSSSSPQRVEEEHISLRLSRNVPSFDAAATASDGANTTAKTVNKRAQQSRCRKHRRRMHLLLADHSWDKSHEDANPGGEDTTAVDHTAPKWLATHLWHAKRMKMTERYGHVLAERRQDKGVSAALTGLRKTATLHDASYYGIVELCGSTELILEALQQLTDPSESDIDGSWFFSGREEGHFVLYQPGTFPSGAIAPVRFMWQPVENEYTDGQYTRPDMDTTMETKRQLWLWIHPAAYMVAATAIANACQGVMSDRDANEEVEIVDRRGQLALFQLRGKDATAILASALHQPSNGTPNNGAIDDSFQRVLDRPSNAVEGSDVISLVVHDPRVHSRLKNAASSQQSSSLSLLDEPPASLLTTQSDILCPLSGTSVTTADNKDEPDSALILAKLEALLKWTTSKPVTGEGTESLSYPYTVPPPHASHASVAADVNMDAPITTPLSPLWSIQGRDQVRAGFRKDHELNAAKTLESAPVPLLLVRRQATFPHTGGWDLVLPPQYAPAILNALVYAGAMVIGLDEQEALATVIHEPSFPRDFPDTAAGQAYWDRVALELEDRHVKKPRAKQIPYAKLGVDCPFQPDWDTLFSLNNSTDDAAEATKHSGGEEVDEVMEEPAPSVCVLRGESYMEPFAFSPSRAINESDIEFIPVAIPTLIRVSLSLPRRGTVEPNSLLYVPSPADVAQYRADAKWSGRTLDTSSAGDQHDALTLLGYVTLAVYDRPKSAFRGTAFCGCEQLQRLVLSQREVDGKLPSQLLAMTRTTSSRQLRPVMLKVQA